MERTFQPISTAEKTKDFTSRYELDEFGVNRNYQTPRLDQEEMIHESKSMQDFSMRYLQLELKIKEIRADQKALKKEYDEVGHSPTIMSKGLRSYIKKIRTTQEEKETEEILHEWLDQVPEIRKLIAEIYDVDAKVMAEFKTPEAQEIRLDRYHQRNREYYKERREREEKAGIGWLDIEQERLAKLAHLGNPEAFDKLREIEALIAFRDARRVRGLPDLPEYNKPIYPDQVVVKDIADQTFEFPEADADVADVADAADAEVSSLAPLDDDPIQAEIERQMKRLQTENVVVEYDENGNELPPGGEWLNEIIAKEIDAENEKKWGFDINKPIEVGIAYSGVPEMQFCMQMAQEADEYAEFHLDPTYEDGQIGALDISNEEQKQKVIDKVAHSILQVYDNNWTTEQLYTWQNDKDPGLLFINPNLSMQEVDVETVREVYKQMRNLEHPAVNYFPWLASFKLPADLDDWNFGDDELAKKAWFALVQAFEGLCKRRQAEKDALEYGEDGEDDCEECKVENSKEFSMPDVAEFEDQLDI